MRYLGLTLLLMAWPLGAVLADEATTPPSSAIANIQNAPDEQSAAAALNTALGAGADSIKSREAFIGRMIQLGQPGNAEQRARELVKLDNKNALGWAVVAFAGIGQDKMTEAVSAAVLAASENPTDPFVVSTAGQVVAWYDSIKASLKPEDLSADTKRSLVALRGALSDREQYQQGYQAFMKGLDEQLASQPPARAPEQGLPAQGPATTGGYVGPVADKTTGMVIYGLGENAGGAIIQPETTDVVAVPETPAYSGAVEISMPATEAVEPQVVNNYYTDYGGGYAEYPAYQQPYYYADAYPVYSYASPWWNNWGWGGGWGWGNGWWGNSWWGSGFFFGFNNGFRHFDRDDFHHGDWNHGNWNGNWNGNQNWNHGNWNGNRGGDFARGGNFNRGNNLTATDRMAAGRFNSGAAGTGAARTAMLSDRLNAARGTTGGVRAAALGGIGTGRTVSAAPMGRNLTGGTSTTLTPGVSRITPASPTARTTALRSNLNAGRTTGVNTLRSSGAAITPRSNAAIMPAIAGSRTTALRNNVNASGLRGNATTLTPRTSSTITPRTSSTITPRSSATITPRSSATITPRSSVTTGTPSARTTALRSNLNTSGARSNVNTARTFSTPSGGSGSSRFVSTPSVGARTISTPNRSGNFSSNAASVRSSGSTFSSRGSSSPAIRSSGGVSSGRSSFTSGGGGRSSGTAMRSSGGGGGSRSSFSGGGGGRGGGGGGRGGGGGGRR